jgi:hypothetical protein
MLIGRWIVKFRLGELRRMVDVFNGVPLTAWSAEIVADALRGIGASDVRVVFVP